MAHLRRQWSRGGQGAKTSTEKAKGTLNAAASTRRPKIMAVRVRPGGVLTEELNAMPELPAAKPQMVDAATQTEAAKPSVEESWGLARLGEELRLLV